MNNFFFKTGNLITNWLTPSDTHTMPGRLIPQSDKIWKQGNFIKQSIDMKNSSTRYCCFNNDPWYVRRVLGPQRFKYPR